MHNNKEFLYLGADENFKSEINLLALPSQAESQKLSLLAF